MFVELHARSAFSFLEGGSLPEEMAATAAAHGMPAMALLDRDGVYGSPRFHLAAKKLGIRAIAGAEVTGTDGCRYPLLVETRTGYQNLCRLITKMKLRAAKGEGAVTREELEEHARGLVCLTGGEHGPVTRALESGGEEQAAACASELRRIFGAAAVFIELQRHLQRDQEARNQAAMRIARKLRLPLVASNGPAYAFAPQRELMDVLTCIREKRTIRQAGRLLERNAERYVKSGKQMERLFADVPEAVANTAELANRLQFTMQDLGYEFPRYPVPDGETMDSFLRKRTEEGARNRYRPYHETARKQIERELALIEKLQLSGYFLIVWDLVRFCREHNIMMQGRGSAANSAVCYALGITAVDPVGMELLFERFLSEERGEWPDIDIDLPSGDNREKVIQYVYERYGRLGAAMTANVITYRGRLAIREIGKVLEFEPDLLGRLAALVHGWEWKDPNDTPERRFREAGLDIDQPYVSRFLNLYKGILDLPRHLGQHSGGMVICQGQLDSVVPLEPASMPGRVVVQWDKDDCADMGIIKVDLLGLGMMAVLAEAQEIIRESYQEEVDLAHLPPDDPDVYAALQTADTVGLFQVESRAQMSCLPRMRPTKFYDIVVQVAIIRPGPIVGKMLHPYLRRRQGKEEVTYVHPDLEPVLARTLGVPLFQEQLLRMAMIVAGFSGGEAEELRRAFGFKRSERRMREVELKLRAGMTEKGIVGDVQDAIIQSITSFALYGFPESHAASFALLAYASAYMKCRYIGAFTAAMLNNQPMGFYSPATLVKDAQRHGLHFRPVDVMRSDWKCTLEDDDRHGKVLRLGLNYVRGLRASVGQAIERERRCSPFTGMDDFVRRVPELHKNEITRLAEVGALNHLPRRDERPGHRRDALWTSELAVRPAGELWEAVVDSESPCPLAPMTPHECAYTDYVGTGLTIGKHSMAFYRDRLEPLGVLRAAELRYMRDGAAVRVAGCVITRQRPGTAKGFVFLSLEDETGICNAIVKPDLFEAQHATIVGHQFLLLEGTLQHQEGVISVKVQNARALPFREPVQSHDFH